MVYDEIAPLAPQIAAARLRPLGGLAFLDSAMRHATLGRYSYVAAAPFAAFTVDADGAMLDGNRLDGPPLAALEAVLAAHRQPVHPDLPPFQGGAIGFIGYEFARHLETLDAPADLDPAKPSLRFDLYDTVLAFDHEPGDHEAGDHEAGRAFVIGARRAGENDDAPARARIARFQAALETQAPAPGIGARPGGLDWRSNFFADDYRAAIQTVRDYILAGDIYQANVAQTFTAKLPDALRSLRALSASCAGPMPRPSAPIWSMTASPSRPPRRNASSNATATWWKPVRSRARPGARPTRRRTARWPRRCWHRRRTGPRTS